MIDRATKKAIIEKETVHVLGCSYSLRRRTAAAAQLISQSLVALWINNAVHTSDIMKRKRGGCKERVTFSSQIAVPAFMTSGGGLFVSHPLSETKKKEKKERARAGDKGPTVGRRCTLYSD